MHPTTLLDLLFSGDLAEPEPFEVRDFLLRYGPYAADDEIVRRLETDDSPIDVSIEPPFQRLVRVALRADRRATAAVAGHQAAIRRVFPDLPDDLVVAFCVSEETGAHPGRMTTALDRHATDDPARPHRLTGTKKWGTLAPDADLLLVAAVTGTVVTREEGQAVERNALQMVAVPTDRPGLRLSSMDLDTELSIANVHLEDVAVADEEVLPGDAYLNAIRPFRLVEDTFNTAATLIGLLRLGLRSGWQQQDAELLEDLGAAVLQAETLSRTALSSATEVLAANAFLRRADRLWSRATALFEQLDEATARDWRPEVGLLGVAARAREMQRQKAWQELAEQV